MGECDCVLNETFILSSLKHSHKIDGVGVCNNCGIIQRRRRRVQNGVEEVIRLGFE